MVRLQAHKVVISSTFAVQGDLLLLNYAAWASTVMLAKVRWETFKDDWGIPATLRTPCDQRALQAETSHSLSFSFNKTIQTNHRNMVKVKAPKWIKKMDAWTADGRVVAWWGKMAMMSVWLHHV